MSFTSALLLAHSQELHHLVGNWEVHSGDFAGSGQAQVLLYDPGTGDAHFLVFARDLSLAAQKSYAGWGKNLVLYPGHFGSPALGIMLYDPAAQQSTFLAFDARLQITLHYTVPSWDQHWQLLVGAFLDRSRCLARGNCTTGDDILLLDRRTGEMQQYIFSFGPRFKVYDNRLQAFLREGAAEARLIAVDAPSIPFETATMLTQACGWLLYTIEVTALLPELRQPNTGAYRAPASLSERERDILALMCQGYTTEETATMLDIAPSTVRKHRENLYAEFGTHSVGETIFAAFASGLFYPIDDVRPRIMSSGPLANPNGTHQD